MEKILIVEDDEELGKGVKLFLEQKGFLVELVTTMSDALLKLDDTMNLIILDRNLPDGNGLTLCRSMREKRRIPIIFLTAMDTNSDIVEGFDAGCDDYLAKPFDLEVLYSRIIAVLRRCKRDFEKELFVYNELTVNFLKKQVTVNNELIKLTATEYRLLELLINNRGQVLTRDTILERIWDVDENFVDENTLNVQIRRLRSKLKDDSKNPNYIITVFGIGYTFGE